MNNSQTGLRKLLSPFGLFYRMAVNLRNNFYDWGLFRSTQYNVPVICIGNITVGGTGKTPHTEYLIELLQKDYRIAVISRGYKRKSKDFILATTESSASEIGDEPFQIKRKYPDVIVAVDGNRRRAIEKLLNHPDPDMRPNIILLDDAFQHRSVTPTLSILLIDSNRMIYEDSLLPGGNLREPIHAKSRANIVIVTKCSKKLKPIDYRVITKNLDLYPYQSLFFTTLEYENLQPVYSCDGMQPILLESLGDYDHILLVTGIATPEYLEKKLLVFNPNITSVNYPDHHHFRKKDLVSISERFNGLKGEKKLIIVTEKDAVRLIGTEGLNDEIKKSLYYIPIKIRFTQHREVLFEKKIKDHINNLKGDKILI
ncbi:MAG: tetraacyldisaccharide 4'-kinase [Bacteroidales bacterium]|nr:tetraacyldisaccharide 4'-kinase [Bacteroidales bacterium]